MPSLLQREVAQEPLDRVDRDGAVEIGAVADALARVVADPPVDRGQRIVGDELTPRLLVPARLSVREPGLDVLAGRAAGVARRQQVDVDGSALPDRAGVGAPVQQVRQRRDVLHRVVHARHRGGAAAAAGRPPDRGHARSSRKAPLARAVRWIWPLTDPQRRLPSVCTGAGSSASAQGRGHVAGASGIFPDITPSGGRHPQPGRRRPLPRKVAHRSLRGTWAGGARRPASCRGQAEATSTSTLIARRSSMSA